MFNYKIQRNGNTLTIDITSEEGATNLKSSNLHHHKPLMDLVTKLEKVAKKHEDSDERQLQFELNEGTAPVVEEKGKKKS